MRSDLLKAVLAAAAYFAMARVGYAFGIGGGLVTLWPPSGLMLGLLLISAKRSWPAIIAGGLAGSMASDLRENYSLALAAFAAFSNLIETLVAALVVQRVAARPLSMNSVRSVVALTLGGAVLANAATALIGMWVLILGFKMTVLRAWFIWWVGDGLGMLVVAPLVIALAEYLRGSSPMRGQRAELALLSAVFVTLCFVGLSPLRIGGVEPGPYVTLPFLFWIAIRFGPLAAASATVVIAAIATWFASSRLGPFAPVRMTEMVAALQVYAYIAAAAVSSLFTAAAVTERRLTADALYEREAELRKSMADLRSVSTRLNEVREDERSRIARDIHDHLGQTLTALKMDVAEVRRRARAGPIAPVEERLSQMSALIDGAIEEVRRIASELQPLLLDEFNLVDALKFYLHEVAHRTGLRCELKAPRAVDLPPDRAGALFRIMQEALTNVTRHSGALRVTVSLSVDQDDARLEVTDDGCGLPPPAERRPGALGLIGMCDRARLHGGDVVITSEAGHGTTISARIPLKDPA
jgi:signal transduction histidine kinase